MEKNSNQLIIDEENFKYLVRPNVSKHYVSLVYGVPRKSKKGYLGMKTSSEEYRTTKEEALYKFANWKEEYVPKFHRKDIIRLRIHYSPIVHYYVTCPVCQQDAEILNWMWICDGHDIICDHCNPYPRKEDALFNRVGICLVNLFHESGEDKTINLAYNNSGIKWEEYVNQKDLLKKF